jgi:hypothetical protein
MIPPPPPEEELPELEPQEVQAAPVVEFQVERVTDDEFSIDVGAEEKLVTAEAADAEEEKPKRGRGRKPVEPRKKLTSAEEKPVKTAARKAAAPKTTARRSRRRGEDEPTESEDAQQFLRVTDEDMRQEAGELLKDAIVQEKIIEHSLGGVSNRRVSARARA